MNLIDPSKEYEQSWLAALDEIAAETSDLNGPGTAGLNTNHCNPRDLYSYIKLNEDWSKGVNLPQGYVPCSNFWLVDGGEFIGVANFRHELTEDLRRIGGHIGYFVLPSKRGQGYGTKLLALSLQRIKETTDIKKVMITCSSSNKASRGVIENNGGVYFDSEMVDGGETLKFWIEISKT